MRYAIWLVFIIVCSIIQSMLNNYLPIYLSPDILLMLVAFVVFFYSYYAALASIIMLSYAASLFSAGNIWLYIFSYLSVFYVLIFLKKFFDRSQGVAIVAIAAFSTLLYPLIVFVLSILSNRVMLFHAAVFMALQQIPVNMVFAYLLFKYLPSISQKLKAGLINQKV